MLLFRVWLMTIIAVLGGYTLLVIAAEGINLFPVFFGDIAKMGWPGQFNLDFLFMLSLSALWVAWRHRWSAAGLVLALLAVNLGALFLSIYLLIVTAQAKGDLVHVLTGGRDRRI